MLRALLFLSAALALLLPGSASARSFQFDVIRLVDRPLEAVREVAEIPVLLPSRMTTEFHRLYSNGRGRARTYEFEIGSVRNCNSATACFVASFRGTRGGTPSNPRKIALVRGHTGWFRPLRCGASCAAPSVEWVQGGVMYTIEAKLGTRRSERRILTQLANSAIRNGAR